MGALFHDMRAELHAKKLEHAEAEADYTAFLFHELRNPLNSISAGIDYAIDYAAVDTISAVQEELRQMSRVMDHVTQLLDNVLDMSKLSANQLVLGCDPFDVNEELTSVCHAIGHLLKPGVELRKQLLETVTFVGGSPRHLRQVLINLLSNALKFTTSGFVSLVVLMLSDDGDRVCLQFQAGDTGCGVSEEGRARLFRKYAQLSRGQEGQKGTGLGLYLSQELVRLMGGLIEVVSPWSPGPQPNEGPTRTGTMMYFTLEFPKRQASTRAMSSLPLDLPTGLRVLVVDDELSNRMLLTRVLTTMGAFKGLEWVVEEACDGSQALEKYQSTFYNIIFMDQNMGDGPTGQQVTRQMRKMGAERGRPLILGISGNCTENDKQLSSESGQDTLFPKPFPRHVDLAQAINIMLKKEKQASASQ
eukprot:NODE_664_length_1531_cov_82.951417_g544_i0.p1 GENE.NODE_664_length_1531_cov_82.951417_g544_i0~~NODE_664_length_1531_cov_82.951417_g544_i0.p1  ORF type:complete len:424 (-),score=135.51 NODE_664_length_1531_cov_82.951417_g544_i0:259-1509(-)